ncbi:MAG: hypothetical protein V1712_00735 [Patescibacteria group bacterium]
MLLHVISNNTRPGFILILVVTVTTALLFLAGYFLEQSTSEIKISKSEDAATKSYYLAEAGVNEAIYKLKNDSNWRVKFLTGTLANETFTRSNVFDNQGSYTITATSLTDALADITATAAYSLGSQQAKRVIKTRLAKATNSAFSWSQSFYAGGRGGQQNGNLTIERNCSVNGGTLHANQNLKVTSHADFTVNNTQVTSSNNIIVNAGANLILNNSTREEGLPMVPMPQVDFDSVSLTSYKNRADQTYTAAQFAALPSGTVLSGITFVSGNAVWTNKNLTINGLLVASGNITINLEDDKILTINSHASGSGILSKVGIIIDAEENAQLNINGLLYATNVFTMIFEDNANFTVTGGIIGWHVTLNGDDTGVCDITYDESLMLTPLDPVYNSGDSPIIEVNHWEEQY